MPRTFDPASTRPALRYIGDGRPVRGAPLRELTEHDLCRLAYRRSLAAGPRPDPRNPDQGLVAAIHDELISRGQFEAVPRETPKPTRAADKEPTDG